MKKKFFKVFMFLAIVFLLFALDYSTSNLNNKKIVREIDIEYRTREEQLASILDSFDFYAANNDNNHIEFASEKLVSFSDSNYEYLSQCQSEVLLQKIATDYDLKKNIFNITICYYDGNELYQSITKETSPVYDEEKDDAYIIVDDDKYYFSDCFNVDEFQQCVFGVDDAVVVGGVVIVGAIALTISAVAPSISYDVTTQITNEVETFFEDVKQTVRSFLSWFTKWVKVAVTKVVQKIVTTVTKITTPAISVNNERIETRAVSASELRNIEKNKYFLAFADTTNNTIYLSSEIKKEVAIAILAMPVVVNCISNDKVQMIASTYTLLRDDAFSIAVSAGLNPMTPYDAPHYENGFYHYHSAASSLVKLKNGNLEKRYPHSFYSK